MDSLSRFAPADGSEEVRVITQQSLLDRLRATIKAVEASGQTIKHIELTEREMQQLHHEVGQVPYPEASASGGIYETRFNGHRVVIV